MPTHTPDQGSLAAVLRPATTLYLELHHHPELSGHEENTAARCADWLSDHGFDVTTGVGGHGVVGVLRNGPGPVVLLRAELDALPVTEDTGLRYASAVPGVMHACGHDLHLAAMAGAAAVLAADRATWSGTLLCVAQPAEETLDGARAMLDDGLYTRFPRPDVALAQHTAPIPAGMVAHSPGTPVTAGSATLRVVIHGRGGHAGTPQLTVDPVVTAAALVLRLQTVVSRETAPTEPLALTVGSLHAGHSPNVVPDHATLELTVRGFSDASLDRAVAAVHRITTAECTAADCPRPPDITTLSRSPVNVPDPDATARVRQAHEALFGPERVTSWPPSTATEDFPAFGAEGVPTVYWMLGVVGRAQWAAATAGGHGEGDAGDAAGGGGGNAGGAPGGGSSNGAGSGDTARLATVPGNHSPRFAPDVRTALPAAISAMVAGTRCFLAPAAAPLQAGSGS